MDTNQNTKLLLKKEVFEIVGSAMEVLNYFKITKLRVGVIINFKHATLEWERLVL